MRSTVIFLLPFVGLTIAAPQDSILSKLKRQIGLGGDVPDGQFAKTIGSFMSIATPLAGAMGIDIKGDMTVTLCKQFNSHDALSQMIEGMFGSPIGKEPGEECVKDDSGGSGPYGPAKIIEEPSLPGHTIYVPTKAPSGKIPVIVWANGFCLRAGTMFVNFLNEIASHGFVVVANGPVNYGNGLGNTTTYRDLLEAIDWVSTNPAVKKYGNVDPTDLAAAGQSCGGLDVYAASEDSRVKHTVLFNSADFDGSGRKHIAKLKTRVAWFLGGPKDIAQARGDRDYASLPVTVPGLKASAPLGHIGTYYQKYGGKFGKAAVAYFKWQMQGDQSLRTQFCNPAPNSPLASAGFEIVTKNGMC